MLGFGLVVLPGLVEIAKSLVVEEEQGSVEEVRADTNHTEVVEHKEEDVGQVERAGDGDQGGS